MAEGLDAIDRREVGRCTATLVRDLDDQGVGLAAAELAGPAAGLDALDVVDATAAARFQPFHAVRADLLARAGRAAEADGACAAALELTTNPAERSFLQGRRAALA